MTASRLRDLAVAARDWLLDLASPRICVGCRGLAEPRANLCGKCRALCLEDDSRPNLPEGVGYLLAGPRHAGAVRGLVHGLKYEGHRAAAGDLADLLVARGALPSDSRQILVPVPLTPARRRERGYNQAECLARELAARTGIPVAKDFLHRVRFRGSQTKRTGGERREALAGMFGKGPGFRAECVPVLVDDVLTTGATLSACAAVCLHGGVPEVRAVCAAWADGD
jgi:ComF family protein